MGAQRTPPLVGLLSKSVGAQSTAQAWQTESLTIVKDLTLPLLASIMSQGLNIDRSYTGVGEILSYHVFANSQ